MPGSMDNPQCKRQGGAIKALQGEWCCPLPWVQGNEPISCSAEAGLAMGTGVEVTYSEPPICTVISMVQGLHAPC